MDEHTFKDCEFACLLIFAFYDATISSNFKSDRAIRTVRSPLVLSMIICRPCINPEFTVESKHSLPLCLVCTICWQAIQSSPLEATKHWLTLRNCIIIMDYLCNLTRRVSLSHIFLAWSNSCALVEGCDGRFTYIYTYIYEATLLDLGE